MGFAVVCSFWLTGQLSIVDNRLSQHFDEKL